jgi:hypothetical protein
MDIIDNRPPNADELKITIDSKSGWSICFLKRSELLPNAYACTSLTDQDFVTALAPHRIYRLLLSLPEHTGIGDHNSVTRLNDAPAEGAYTPILRFTAQMGQRTFELLRHQARDQAIPYLLREITPSP